MKKLVKFTSIITLGLSFSAIVSGCSCNNKTLNTNIDFNDFLNFYNSIDQKHNQIEKYSHYTSIQETITNNEEKIIIENDVNAQIDASDNNRKKGYFHFKESNNDTLINKYSIVNYDNEYFLDTNNNMTNQNRKDLLNNQNYSDSIIFIEDNLKILKTDIYINQIKKETNNLTFKINKDEDKDRTIYKIFYFKDDINYSFSFTYNKNNIITRIAISYDLISDKNSSFHIIKEIVRNDSLIVAKPII